jgi:hypothetical protein
MLVSSNFLKVHLILQIFCTKTESNFMPKSFQRCVVGTAMQLENSALQPLVYVHHLVNVNKSDLVNQVGGVHV